MITTREQLRLLIDLVWNEATESQEVPYTAWADEIIDRWQEQENIKTDWRNTLGQYPESSTGDSEK